MQLDTTSTLQSIIDFNQQAGLLDAGYNDFLESSFQIEEALESFNLGCFYSTPKDASRAIVQPFTFEGTDVDRFDKHLDSIVFNIGSLAKLGLNLDQILRGLAIVMQANFTKLNAGKDEFGKQLKPANFIPPEPQLQAILDER